MNVNFDSCCFVGVSLSSAVIYRNIKMLACFLFCKTVEIILKWHTIATYTIFRVFLTICLNDIGYTNFSMNGIHVRIRQYRLKLRQQRLDTNFGRYVFYCSFWHTTLFLLLFQYEFISTCIIPNKDCCVQHVELLNRKRKLRQ